MLGQAYGILTNVIQERTFGVGVQPHMALKGLKKHHNLRDHMTSLELLFTTLGERSTKDIAIADNAHGLFLTSKQRKREGRWPVTPEKPWKSKQATRWFQMTTSCPPKVIRSNCRHPRMSKPPTLANSYGAVVNRLSQEFTVKCCTEDGLIAWPRLVAFSSATKRSA